ncbi:hypothetical protein [Pelorhabdus rhamnosifermentans]|uniref:hypothetical protein n=1 Tax=Pelorhabdus rhamnosifermentans TaxID=2772457 RepID=UPI001C06359D|nr:hypothetical protein [Pelorhabdus rhamnosifermentans]
MSFFLYDFIIVVPAITIEDVEIIKSEPFNKPNYSYAYAVNEADSKKLMESKANLKKALVTFKYANQSFFKTIYDVKGQYARPENLPPIIVGKKPDMPALTPVNIYSKAHPRKYHSQEFRMTVLIDPQNYSDAEILEMLKSVEVILVGGKNKVLAKLPLSKAN